MKILGIDIGSVAIKTVLIKNRHIVLAEYTRIKSTLLEALDSALKTVKFDGDELVAFTGRGATRLAEQYKVPVINEIFAQASGAFFLDPTVRSIIDIGGHDAAFIRLSDDAAGADLRLKDFSTNSRCAAGTGSFLDQQAVRLGYDIEGNFANAALSAVNVPRIAGRCSVFAKSDMIHLQQIATPDNEILAGLCSAMAESFKSDILKGRQPELPVMFQGGVAANRAMVHFMRKVFGLDEQQLRVDHNYCRFTGAIGAALRAVDEQKTITSDQLKEFLLSAGNRIHMKSGQKLPVLKLPDNAVMQADHLSGDLSSNLFLGIDIGSISTNLVLLDEKGDPVWKKYLMTAGRPIEAVKQGFVQLKQALGDDLNIAGCGTTGSGRYLIGDLFGADLIKNEITAQARGASALYPDVDTVFEIGGQDSKYISIRNGVVADFTMNKACAAGTGSFLEEQAGLMGISVKEQFAEYAFQSDNPTSLGQRCTVFIETDLVRQMGEGESIGNLCAGLSYSIVHNYLNRVVEHRHIGKKILFQGGTAFNRAVTAAFSAVLGRTVFVPPHNEVTGAYGMADIVREAWLNTPFQTAFAGLDSDKLQYEVSTFVCNSCANNCEIRRVVPAGSATPLFYGHRCEKYENRKRTADSDGLNFNLTREKLQQKYLQHDEAAPGTLRIGIPLGLGFHETIPFWHRLLTGLGAEVVLSGNTNRSLIRTGLELTTAETCFPMKVFHGHAAELLNRDVDYIFIPAVVNMELDGSEAEHNFNCTLAQSAPFLLNAAFRNEPFNTLAPVVHMQGSEKDILRELQPLRELFDINKAGFRTVYREARNHFAAYRRELTDAAQHFLAKHQNRKVAVLVSRPYNGYDNGLNLEIPKKLAELGVPSIHIDSIDPQRTTGDSKWRNMFWRYGQKIVSALNWLKDKPDYLPVFLSNFNCGPDSFIMHYAADIMQSKPVLFLELDEHSADAGIVTRLEAFLDSVHAFDPQPSVDNAAVNNEAAPAKLQGKQVFIPNMCDDAIPIAASFRREGIDSRVLPEPDQSNLDLGQKITSGKECYPLTLTTGDLLRLSRMDDFQPGKTVFFMPTTNGPCRFGEYARLQKILLAQAGVSGIEIFSPSSGDGYDALKELSGSFYYNIWKGMVCVDILHKALLKTRPREAAAGQTEQVYHESLKELELELEKRSGDVMGVMRRSRDRFDAIKTVPRKLVPIGMVGEIYVRLNRFANGDIIKTMEEMGAEIVLAPFGEWSFYANYLAMKNFQDQGKWWKAFGERLKNTVQYRIEHRYSAPFAGYGLFYEPHVQAVVEAADPAIDLRIRGEAVLSVGKAVDFIDRGFAGIINVMPFSCMPGLIVSSLVPALREQYNDIPWLNLSFEESGSGVDRTFLEAFLEQARAYQAKYSVEVELYGKTHSR